MPKQVRISVSAATIVTNRTLTETLIDYGNPIDWMQLHKVMHEVMHSLKNELGKQYKHDEIFDLVIRQINQQIASDYRHGATNLSKRCGWFRRKHKNVV
tara:strand:+ start:125 stop:421 length:297 start_codon:yes stop_codon:yes gene_type:complete